MAFSSQHHSFDIKLAEIYGVHEAIIIHHFQHWIRINYRQKKNYHDGRIWSYQTVEEIADHFPYFSVDQIRNILDRLCTGKAKNGKTQDFDPVLMKGNFNKSKFDRTTWYSFADSKFLYEREYSQMGVGILPNPIDTIPEPIPDTKPYAKTNPPPQPPKKPRVDLPKSKEDWRRRFSSEWSLEEFEFAWNKLENSKETIASIEYWLPVVMNSFRLSNSFDNSTKTGAERNKKQAFRWDGLRHRGDTVYADKDSVVFTCGPHRLEVSYAVTKEEWFAKTGWNEND